MAIVVRFEVSGMSEEKYREVLRRLEEVGEGAPPGRLRHIAFGDPGNLQVIDEYDGPSSFERFGQKLVPILQELQIQAEPLPSPVLNEIAGVG